MVCFSLIFLLIRKNCSLYKSEGLFLVGWVFFCLEEGSGEKKINFQRNVLLYFIEL